MKIVIMVTVVAIAMGSLFHEDIVQSFSAKGSGSQAGIPAVKSAGNLGLPVPVSREPLTGRGDARPTPLPDVRLLA
jgi:hypothetical protein